MSLEESLKNTILTKIKLLLHCRSNWSAVNSDLIIKTRKAGDFMIIFCPKRRGQKELELLAESAEMLIDDLMSMIERLDIDLYTKADLIAQADDWLKWYNGELNNEDEQEVCQQLTNKNF